MPFLTDGVYVNRYELGISRKYPVIRTLIGANQIDKFWGHKFLYLDKKLEKISAGDIVGAELLDIIYSPWKYVQNKFNYLIEQNKITILESGQEMIFNIFSSDPYQSKIIQHKYFDNDRKTTNSIWYHYFPNLVSSAESVTSQKLSY